jgi:hypothetical protein
MTKIDPTTFRPGDIVHVRGKVVSYNYEKKYVNLGFEDDNLSFNCDEIVAHFPAIRSWSEIEGRLTSVLDDLGLTAWGNEASQAIIALLNEIDPKGDA